MNSRERVTDYYRLGIFLFCSLLLLSGCASSDKGAQNGRFPVEDSTVGEATDTESNPPLSPTPPVPEVFPERIDPLAEVTRLWNLGRLADARNRFSRTDCRQLAYGERRDEWRMWRGKLFTMHWDSGDLGTAGNNYSSLLIDTDDIWTGTWTGGLVRLAWPLNSRVVHDVGQPSLAVRTVNRIIRYRNEIIVLRYAALERYNLRNGSWKTQKQLPVQERLQDLIYSNGSLYLATLGHGLWRENATGWEKLTEPGLFITRLEHSDVHGGILVATMDRGLFVLQTDSKTTRWTQAPAGPLRKENITSIFSIGNRVYLGTYGSGAYYWDRETNLVEHFGMEELGDLWVLSVSGEPGRVYFGTFGAGVAVFNPEEKSWNAIEPADGLLSSDISSLSVAADGALWAGTLGGGIVRIDREFHEY